MNRIRGLVGGATAWVASGSGALALLTATVLIMAAQRLPIQSGDTTALANSASSLVNCLNDGLWSGCPGSTQFGVTQYLPAMLLAWRGMTPDGIVLVLGLLNLLCFAFTAYLVWRLPLVQPWIRSVLILCVICSPLIAYAPFTFSEGLVSFLVIASIYSLRTGQPILYALTTIGAIASKETAAVSLVPILLAVFIVTPRETRVRLRVLVTGFVSGVACLLIFNVFKFGTWRNIVHSDPILRATGTGRRFEIFLGLLFSPNGGLFWYWPAALLVAVVLVVALSRGRAALGSPAFVASLLTLAGFAAQLVGLANWYAPFGWVAWGPRLMVPTASGLIVGSLLIADARWPLGAEANRAMTSLKIVVLRVGVAVSAVLSLVASVGFLHDPNASLSWFGRVSPVCPTPAIIQQDPAYYFKCLSYGMWNTDQSIIQLSVESFSGRWASLALAAVLVIAFQSVRGRSLGDSITQVERNQDYAKDQDPKS